MSKVLLYGVLSLILLCKANQDLGHDRIVACWVVAWSVYRPSQGSFALEQIDPTLCTHLLYFTAGIKSNTSTIISIDPFLDLDEKAGKGGYRRAVSLKRQNKDLKVLISVGGWGEGSEKFSNIAGDPQKKRKFIDSCVELLRIHNFDGLNLDWQYPVSRGGKPEDKANYVTLVKDFKEAFKPHGYLLTASFGDRREVIETSYDVAELDKHLDLMFMTCHTYHGFWDGVIGANTPLRGQDREDNDNVEYSVNYMLSAGASRSKLILGIATTGRNYLLKEPAIREVTFGQTPALKPSFQGPYTKEDGFMGYNEICQEISGSVWRGSNWKELWDEKSSTPYIRKDDRIIVYDNARSVAIKAKYSVDMDLRGVMIWSLDTDDFRGDCQLDKYPFVDIQESLDRIFYNASAEQRNGIIPSIVRECKLNVRASKHPNNKYPLTRTVHEALLLAVQAKTFTRQGIIHFIN